MKDAFGQYWYPLAAAAGAPDKDAAACFRCPSCLG